MTPLLIGYELGGLNHLLLPNGLTLPAFKDAHGIHTRGSPDDEFQEYGSNHNSLRESCKFYIFSHK